MIDLFVGFGTTCGVPIQRRTRASTSILSRMTLAFGFEQNPKQANDATPFVPIVDDQYVLSGLSPSLDVCRTYHAVKQKWALPDMNSAHLMLNYFKFVFWFFITHSFLISL
jgi:hypothetical protein